MELTEEPQGVGFVAPFLHTRNLILVNAWPRWVRKVEKCASKAKNTWMLKLSIIEKLVAST